MDQATGNDLQKAQGPAQRSEDEQLRHDLEGRLKNAQAQIELHSRELHRAQRVASACTAGLETLAQKDYAEAPETRAY
jgi:hypothetical protein